MQIGNRVRYSEELVRDIEAMNADQWRRMRLHPKYPKFMWEYLRAKCVSDFWYHIKYGVYYRAIKHYDVALHGPDGVAGWLQKWRREQDGIVKPVSVKMLFVAREHCKTQIALAYDSWEYARDVNQRLLIRAFVSAKAEELGGALLEILDSEQYKRMYPWVRPKTKSNGQTEQWNKSRFMLERPDTGVRVPSCETCGVDGEPTGGHFNMGHYDDYEVQRNANSDVLREQMINVWLNDSNLFLAGSRRLFCGTPWGRSGMIYKIMKGREPFEDKDYDIFVQPCTVRVFDMPFSGDDCVLDGDRETVSDPAAGFPHHEDNLVLCQARVRFINPSTRDVCEETREIVWNDGNAFRVNRPFPEMLGAPLGYVISAEKPACPTRFTLDAQDWIPPVELSSAVIARQSLVKKRKEQGSLVYSAQMMMDPVDEENLILNPDLIQRIAADQIPEGDRNYFRCVDFATGGRTSAATAITTGFWHANGLFIQRINYKNAMNILEKLWELFTGELWVQGQGYRILFTTLEKAAVERDVGDLLPEVEPDPWKYFKHCGARYASLADQFFVPGKPVHIGRRTLSRGAVGKTLRISKQQPLWEGGRLWYIEGAGFWDVLEEQAKTFRLDSEDSFDLLDTIADLVSEGYAPRVHEVQERGRNLFAEQQRKARLRTARARGGMARAR